MDELDGVIAAPDHHRVLFENDEVRVVETVIQPGDTVPLHTHLSHHTMVVLSGSHFVRRDHNGDVMVDTRAGGEDFEMPTVMWSDGLPAHTLENTGDDVIRTVATELK